MTRRSISRVALWGCLLMLLMTCIDASANQIVVHRGIGKSAWQLQANQVTLNEILQALEAETGAVIHHSLGAEKRVSATCVADALSGILKCLLGESANVVFGPSQGSIPSEIWILGSTAAAGFGKECVTEVSESERKFDSKADIQILREQLNSSDPRLRGDALYALAATDADDADDVLRSGFTDSSSLVREQALGGWVRRHGTESATTEIYQAMSDVEATVRLRAVELTDDPMLLRRATTDDDASVRLLAQAKLHGLEK